MKQQICQHCHKPFDHKIKVKYCSNSCKQAAYRARKSGFTGVTKKSTRTCIRCGRSVDKGRYCSTTCKAMTNREKHTATYRLKKSISGMSDHDVWTECDKDWKVAYRHLESLGFTYSASNKCWMVKGAQLELPLGIQS